VGWARRIGGGGRRSFFSLHATSLTLDPLSPELLSLFLKKHTPALHMAAANGHVAIVQALLDAGAVSFVLSGVAAAAAAPPSTLSLAHAQHPPSLSLSLSPRLSQDASAPNAQGNTPLHWACLNGVPAAVAALLAGGASPAALNAAERTPVDEAQGRGDGAGEACLVAIREWAAATGGGGGSGSGATAADVAEVEAAVAADDAGEEEGGGMEEG
jgi:ankyrin repeat protein